MDLQDHWTRPGWDEYFLDIAQAVSARADCRRRSVGCVLVKDNRIVSTGYNGAPAGQLGCLEGACPRGLRTFDETPAYSSYGDCIAIHAEANALLYADHSDTRGAVAYITDEPCGDCRKLLSGAGVQRVVWPEGDWWPGGHP